MDRVYDRRRIGGNRAAGSLADNPIISPVLRLLSRQGGHDSVPEGFGNTDNVGLIRWNAFKEIIPLRIRNRPVKLDTEALEDQLYPRATRLIFNPDAVSVAIEKNRSAESGDRYAIRPRNGNIRHSDIRAGLYIITASPDILGPGRLGPVHTEKGEQNESPPPEIRDCKVPAITESLAGRHDFLLSIGFIDLRLNDGPT